MMSLVNSHRKWDIFFVSHKSENNMNKTLAERSFHDEPMMDEDGFLVGRRIDSCGYSQPRLPTRRISNQTPTQVSMPTHAARQTMEMPPGPAPSILITKTSSSSILSSKSSSHRPRCKMLKMPLRRKVSIAPPDDDSVVTFFHSVHYSSKLQKSSYRPDPPSSAVLPRSNPSTYLEDRFVTVYKPTAREDKSNQEEVVPSIMDAVLRDGEVNSSGRTSSSSAFFVVTNANNSGPAPTKKKALDIHHARAFLKELLTRYKVLKIVQICLAVYVGVWTYAGGLRDQDTGMIVDPNSEERTSLGWILVNGSERPIVAETMFQLIAVYISRLNAWFMYPGEYLSSSCRCYKATLVGCKSFLIV
jgi:hypothetical protein